MMSNDYGTHTAWHDPQPQLDPVAQALLEALEGLVARHTLPSGRCTECGIILIEGRCSSGCELDEARAAMKAARHARGTA